MKIKYHFFSKRLGFRLWLPDDAPIYKALSTDPVVMKYFPKAFWLDGDKANASIHKFNKHFEKHKYTYFAVDHLEADQFIGFIGLKEIEYDIFFAPAIDIGWRLREPFWGQGLATEGAKRALDWFGQNFNHKRIVSLTPIQNKSSERVMQKIGMTKVCEFEHPLLDTKDPLRKHVLYEIHL